MKESGGLLKMSLIKLDIAADYPIGWSFKYVIREFVQNFYDSLGADDFYERFHFNYFASDGGLNVVMETEGIGFSYDWLTYVGGSTKTESLEHNIGMYGEGFKMSALRILQMQGMILKMHSQDWEIQPVKYIECVDGHNLEMFGYEYNKALADGYTRLEVTGVALSNETVLKEALLDFFCPQNPLVGEMIGRGSDWEIYNRSEMKIPCEQRVPELKGILFMNNLARGRLDIPIVINYKTRMLSDTRSRETFSDSRTADYIHEVVKLLDAQTSFRLLEIMKNRWDEYPKGKYDINTKYYFICQLVRNVVKNEEIKKNFMLKHTDLAFIERKGSDIVKNRLIDETKTWARENNTRRIVNPIFRLVGASSLLEEYQTIKNMLYVLPNSLEIDRANLLYKSVKEIINVSIPDEMPEILIDECADGKSNPLQFAERDLAKAKGRKYIRFKINKLVFKHEDFADEAFRESFIKMAEAILHVYGSDRSTMLTVLLTHLGQWILDGADVLSEYEKKWNS